MSQVSSLIARQPICNKQLKVIGFELLYRMNNNTSNAAIFTNDDNATIDVILSTFNDLSIQEVVGEKLAFINFSSNLLLNQLPPITPKQLVIELLEDQKVTPALLKSLERLKKKGYKIALDDFCLTQKTIALIEHADIIKLDVLAVEPENWTAYIPHLKSKGIALLAEKVESYHIYEKCCNLGFDLFQGYFFSKPKIISGKRISNNQLTILSLLGELNRPNQDIEKVTQIISQDTNISYNLLRSINSGLFFIPHKIDSIKHAIMMLGLTHLKNWVNFLALSSLDGKPQVLTDLAIMRAKMCEYLGKVITKRSTADDYFTLGLFSLLDAFFDIPLQILVDKLPLANNMKKALLEYEGEMGIILNYVIKYEQENGQKKPCHKTLNNDTLIVEHIDTAYLNSLKWVEENRRV